MRSFIATSAVVLALVLLVGSNVDAQKDPSVKEIMMKAHGKDGLRAKVIKGTASNDEKKALIDLYTALAASKAPKGDADDWKKRTEKVVELVKSGTPADLNKIDCMGCHKAFKGK
jgi:hypothetical protein